MYSHKFSSIQKSHPSLSIFIRENFRCREFVLNWNIGEMVLSFICITMPEHYSMGYNITIIKCFSRFFYIKCYVGAKTDCTQYFQHEKPSTHYVVYRGVHNMRNESKCSKQTWVVSVMFMPSSCCELYKQLKYWI